MVETRSRNSRVDNGPVLKFGTPIVLKRKKLASETSSVDDIVPVLKDSTPIFLKRKKLATDEPPTTTNKNKKFEEEQVEKQKEDLCRNEEHEPAVMELDAAQGELNAEDEPAILESDTAQVFETIDDMEDVISSFLEQVEAQNEDMDMRLEDAPPSCNVQESEGIDSDVEATENASIFPNEQDLESEDTESDAEGSSIQKKKVDFNDKGQPIGEGSAAFTSYLGSMARKHCPISYEQWRDVPPQRKDKIWKLINDNYVIPALYREAIFQKIRTSWRNFKCNLRARIYDKFDTDKERKRQCPTGVRQAHWEIFVDNQSKPTTQARRKIGKLARQAMKTPHTSGRKGAARTAEDLKKANPGTSVTRTELFLAVHCRKDGSCVTEEVKAKVDRIKAITEKDPSSVNLDVNHDPVRQVCGPEKGGSVRGMGLGINRSSLLRTAPIIDKLEYERKLRISAEKEIAELREKLKQLQKDSGLDNCENSPSSGNSFDCSPIDELRKQVEEMKKERRLWSSAEEEVAFLKEQVVEQRELLTAQGLMLADTRELMIRLCS